MSETMKRSVRGMDGDAANPEALELDLATVDHFNLPDELQGAQADFFLAIGAPSPFPFVLDRQRKNVPPIEVAYGGIGLGPDKRDIFTYSRYARYSVTVTFQGRSRGYNAMFLFGTGEEPVLVLDNVTNNSALNFFVKNSVYPAVLLRKSSIEPGVAAWLRSHQVRDAGCSGGKQEVCCDTSALKCGVSADDLTSALSGSSSQVAKPRDAPSVVSDHANSAFCN